MKKANRHALSQALYNVSQMDTPSAAARAIALHFQNECNLDGESLRRIREGIQTALEAIPQFDHHMNEPRDTYNEPPRDTGGNRRPR